MHAPTLRLLADDLTGALDTAAEFVGLCGPVTAVWTVPPRTLPAAVAVDTGTREMDAAEACRVVAGAAGVLAPAGIAFKKIDSLFRGSTLAELACVVAGAAWQHTVLAPAFPFQGRVTRSGRQWAGGMATGPDLVAALRRLGLPAHLARPGEALLPGVSVFDAEQDADLDAVVAAVGRDAPVLWCGTGWPAPLRPLARRR